jgi:hypothetical protein
MPRPSITSFSRYLAAKKSVDDRALNRYVWGAMAQAVSGQRPHNDLHILEIGAGIGTMVERVLEWGLVTRSTRYTAIDSNPENIIAARDRVARFGVDRGDSQAVGAEGKITLTSGAHTLRVSFEPVALDTFAAEPHDPVRYDLLMAHAVLDLLDVPSSLPKLISLAANGGLLYLTLNFDGATILEPSIDQEFDRLIEELYHQTMDERKTDGKPSGDRYTGRHLFQHLAANGVQVIAAGSSDWIVFPTSNGYPADEAFFLHFIIDTIAGALRDHPGLEQGRFSAWVEGRHAQIEQGKLVYIAHQIDILAQR